MYFRVCNVLEMLIKCVLEINLNVIVFEMYLNGF